MKTYVILIHGFNVMDGGKRTVGNLKPYFEAQDCEVYTLNYGYFGPLSPRWRNDNVARRVDDLISMALIAGYRVVLVGHSNAADIANKTSQPVDKAVLINPALDKKRDLAPNLKRIDVWHSPSDRPVRWARLLPFHPWGEMGAKGYTGIDARVRNFNKQRDFKLSSKAHSDVFKGELLEYFGPIIVEKALA